MKLKKILSTALTVIMLFSAIAAVIPVNSQAAHTQSSVSDQSKMSLEQIKSYINDEYLKYNFNTAEEMLNHELSLGYLDYVTSADGLNTIYINRYTGFVFYRNNYTGQILTSNPVNPGYNNNSNPELIMGQITAQMVDSANTTITYTYDSIKWAALYGQINVSQIAGGLRVSYTLGDTTTRFLLPGLISAEKYEEQILIPIIEQFDEAYKMVVGDNAEYYFDLGSAYSKTGCINIKRLTRHIEKANGEVDAVKNVDKKLKNQFTSLKSDLLQILNAYTQQDPQEYINSPADKGLLDMMYKNYPITQTGLAVYSSNNREADNAKKRAISNIIKLRCPEYNISKMYQDEAEVGYVHVTEQKPVLRCALEYTFNSDNSLSVRLPASSLSFDETAYTLRTITPLEYFGYGDMSDEGYIFFPDGSGAVVDFNDFYNEATGKKINLSLIADVFGQDYCYSKITGAHREQISMPVFGIVSRENVNASTAAALKYRGIEANRLNTGFFAILEEGASLATLNFQSGGSTHKFASVYASYEPYPQDTFDLSETISVGSLGEYIMVADSKYTGSYVTRYTMLTDGAIGESLLAGDYTPTSYAGMAAYYRQYLKNDGTLGAIDVVSEDLPLYIEVLGSMTITSQFLTFPIEESIPLTSFADILTMYKELSKSKETVNAIIEENLEKAKEAEDDDVRDGYLADAERYQALLDKIQNIRNINFRLTGFANDGMHYTYPTKVSWERACGGESGFEHLVSETQKISSVSGVNFSVYPEFDFMYISNTGMFDGISLGDTASRMVDNRYASKQIYNSVLQEYETFFTMVVSSDMFDSLYSEFNEDYSEYGNKKLSASTLGSDLNSNFDDDNPINRDQSRVNISALLNRMKNEDGYEVMVDKGNIYSVKYASHILNVAIDSSHFTYSSYTVPFVAMILHGHTSYSGTPLNYTGSIDYEILRSIESGAAPYYILCYQNTSYMKEDEQLNQYYGVDYTNWYDDMLVTYAVLNEQIGALQDYEIVDHKTLIAERTVTEAEKEMIYSNLEAEFLALLDAEIQAKIDDAFKALRENGASYDIRVKAEIDVESIAAQFRAILVKYDVEIKDSFDEKLSEIVAKYTGKYSGAALAENNEVVTIKLLENYSTQYKYYTDSEALDSDYTFTDFTLDSGKVVMVTYQKGDSVVRFVLNFNIYSVTVTIDGEEVVLGKYQYHKLVG